MSQGPLEPKDMPKGTYNSSLTRLYAESEVAMVLAELQSLQSLQRSKGPNRHERRAAIAKARKPSPKPPERRPKREPVETESSYSYSPSGGPQLNVYPKRFP